MLSAYDALSIARRHVNAMFDELLGAARVSEVEPPAPHVIRAGAADPIAQGDWREVGRRSGISYRWMDGNVDEYVEFVVYEDAGSNSSMGIGKIAPREIRGKERSYRVVFSMDGTKLEPLAVFNESDDFEASKELLALVRGKGATKRAFYAPGDALPPAYDGFTVETFSDRISGPRSYNRLAVVAKDDDPAAMLDFARIQNILRFGA